MGFVRYACAPASRSCRAWPGDASALRTTCAGLVLESPQHLRPGDVGQMEIEQDQSGAVLRGHRQAQPALHRRQQLHPRPPGEHMLDQVDVRRVVLDVEHDRPVLEGGSA